MKLLRAELFKLRTTNMWWVFALAWVLTTGIVLTVNCFNAHALLKPFAQYVSIQTHGHETVATADAAHLDHLRSDWLLGHNTITQASTIYTSGQLIGLLLACLLAIVLVTIEFQQLTATSTFLTTPRRRDVIAAKLGTALIVAGLAWLVTSAISVVVGAIFLHQQGYPTHLGTWAVDRSILLNLAAYLLWALFGTGFGTLIRNQLGATIGATILYLVGSGAAGALFTLLNTYVIKHDWVLTAQVVVPSVASTVMISPTKTFDQSPAPWVGAVVMIAWAIGSGVLGVRALRRRDIA
ncbi:MAG: ABC transporter permease [Nocardioidaceae bacterium]|nr:ABC transporter permease [Nocardioidaceae bacterium]MCL2614243.1 ABC transporter permease [Nocardioidaceae bacterium]